MSEEVKDIEIKGLPETWDDLMKCFDEAEDEYERGETIPWEDARIEYACSCCNCRYAYASR